ncbi:MAG: hypothetical protein AVDCRST_MAG07-3257 [uncultured Frankineae bacterium]|uniref:Aminoglycoside phosphotransferase domain-containing protein n=1 Tax=uncultured Frankineae bacterium TaxID=437475 RepID=A0A6J4MCZ4_9ACTN|nr:MAG: hypothetical protein AVDCRST_MAG07-3257 [uncultured Frankineae bacterium]
MGTRALLGPADVDDASLTSMVGDALAVDDVQVLDCSVEVVDYDLDALTTAGRFWVRGTAQHGDGRSPYAFFVKVVQSWSRTPQFQMVPEQMRELAAAGLPWEGEPLVYRSDLAQRLPAGLGLPRVHLVRELDELSACMWLQAVDADPSPWEPARFERAAYLLGRLAASTSVEPLGALGMQDVVRSYVHGRVSGQVVPALHSDALWAHPLVADAFSPELRTRVLAAADALPALVAELHGAPVGVAHGDACVRNLLVPRDGTHDFVLIDFSFWCRAPLGFDLTQLLVGEVQLGERSAAELPELHELCLRAYVRGLQDEGCDVALDTVRRVQALLMLLFAGLSSVPVELAYGMPAPGGADVVSERASAAAFVLDLVDATGGV